MRRHIALVCLTIGLGAAWGQNPFEPDTHIACVQRLPIPSYPASALQGRTEGTITAAVTLSPQASVQLVTTEFQTKTRKTIGLLIQSVEQAIREAAFRSSCGGQTVALVFDFKLAGPQPASFGYPNKFWIVAGPAAPAHTMRP